MAASNVSGEELVSLSPSTGKQTSSSSTVEDSSPLSIPQQIFRKKMVLLDAFHSADINKDGEIPLSMWSDVMQHILKLKINWVALLPALISVIQPNSSFIEDTSNRYLASDSDGQPAINYLQFLNSFTVSTKSFGK